MGMDIISFADQQVVSPSGATQYLTAIRTITPFEGRASILMNADFAGAYGSGNAAMTVALQVSLDGDTWYTTTIHDRLQIPTNEAVSAAADVAAAQNIQVDGVTINTDLKAEIADIVNWFPYMRLLVVNPHAACTISAWLVSAG